MRKLLYFVMILGILLVAMSVTVAQDANWCDPGGPWDDGRCDNPNPNIAAYYWNMGWMMANHVDPSGMAPTGGFVAVDDVYSSDEGDIKCNEKDYVPASEGLLANDFGEGIEVIDYSGLSRGGDLLVWSDGSFHVKHVLKKGEHKFTYTVTGGATAEVTLNICK